MYGTSETVLEFTVVFGEIVRVYIDVAVTARYDDLIVLACDAVVRTIAIFGIAVYACCYSFYFHSEVPFLHIGSDIDPSLFKSLFDFYKSESCNFYLS